MLFKDILRCSLLLFAFIDRQAWGVTTIENCPHFLEAVGRLFGQELTVSREVDPIPIREQAGKTCASHAVTSALEHRLMRHTGEKIGLSSDYLLLQTLAFELRNAGLKALGEGKGDSAEISSMLRFVLDTASSHRVRRYEWPILGAMGKFGLVPDESWPAGQEIEKALEKGTLKKELISNLGKLARTVKEPDALMKTILKLSSKVIGKPLPWYFQFRGRTFNPLSFKAEYDQREVGWSIWEECVEHKTSEILQLRAKSLEAIPSQFVKFALDTPTSFDQIQALIKKNIDQGIPLLASVYADRLSFGRGQVLVDLQIPPASIHNAILQGEILRRLDEYKATHLTNHAVLVVGYAADDLGRIGFLKLQNSWGKQLGVEGYVFVDYLSFLAITSSFRPVD